MHQPRRHVQKIPSPRGHRMFAALAPLDVRFAFQHVRDGFLRSVMMDSRPRSRLNQERTTPQCRLDAQIGRHRRKP